MSVQTPKDIASRMATPYWSAWPDTTEDGIPMARVKLDVGQHSFAAAAQFDPADPESFAHRVHNVMNAISMHARGRGWIK